MDMLRSVLVSKLWLTIYMDKDWVPPRPGYEARVPPPEVSDGYSPLCLFEDVQEHPRPVAAIAQLAEVREGLLGRADRLLHLGELVAQGDEELAVALALVGRQGEDTG